MERLALMRSRWWADGQLRCIGITAVCCLLLLLLLLLPEVNRSTNLCAFPTEPSASTRLTHTGDTHAWKTVLITVISPCEGHLTVDFVSPLATRHRPSSLAGIGRTSTVTFRRYGDCTCNRDPVA